MPTPEHNDVVAALAGVLADAFGADTALHRIADNASDDIDDIDLQAGFDIAFDAEGSQLTGLLAVLDGVSVAYEAATATVLYDLARPNHLSEGLDAGQLRSIVNDGNLSFDIVELLAGSFGGVLRAQFRSPVSRKVAIAVATVGTVALNVVFPPIVIPTLIVAAGATVIDVGSAIQEARADREVQRERERTRDRIQQLEQTAASREKDFAELSRRVIDLEAAVSANVHTMTVTEPARQTDA